MDLKILHIINGYWSRDLYSLLIFELNKRKIRQTVFIPVRKKSDIGKFQIKKENVSYLYAYIISSVIYRIIFWLKIRKSIKYIENNTDLNKINLTHSQTLFSDGAISYYFFKKYGIKYITTVRNTDLNIFFKYLVYLRPLGKKILLNSEKIIFLSESYKKRLINRYSSEKTKNILLEKSIVIPNGINNFWHQNSNKEKKIKKKDDMYSFIFAGEFKRNKNIHSIIKAVDEIRQRGYKCRFTAIGLGFNDDEEYVKYLLKSKKDKNYIDLIDAVNKEELAKYYREADIFILPTYFFVLWLIYF